MALWPRRWPMPAPTAGRALEALALGGELGSPAPCSHTSEEEWSGGGSKEGRGREEEGTGTREIRQRLYIWWGLPPQIVKWKY